jgi:hypothetical protein
MCDKSRKRVPPPSTAEPQLHLNHLWQQLTAIQRQQLCQALSLLIAQHLRSVNRKEVSDET